MKSLRLLLDEHFSPKLARLLRDRGVDAVAVSERPEMLGLSDAALVEPAFEQQRAVVTRNHGDFRPLVAAAMARGELAYGLICVTGAIRPGLDSIGYLADILTRVCTRIPDGDGLASYGREIWLSGPED